MEPTIPLQDARRPERWSAMLDEVERQRVELARVSVELARLQAHAQSTDRLVSVTLDARGVLRDLTIAPAAMRRLRAEQLSAVITDLVADADARLHARRSELLEATTAMRPGLADLRSDTAAGPS